MPSKEVIAVAREIGKFYVEKHNGDYEAAQKEIGLLDISDIQVDCSHVYITTSRPGMLIGRRASNFDALEKFLRKKLKVFENVDSLQSYLMPSKSDEENNFTF